MAIDPKEAAASHFLLLYTLLQKAEAGEKVGKPVRSRAREAPGMLLSSGLLGFLTFYASKSDKEVVDKLASGFCKSTHIGRLQEAQRIAEEIAGDKLKKKLYNELGEGGKGYSVLLSMVIAYLASQGIIGEEASMKGLIEGLRRLSGEPWLETQAQDMLLPYLVQVKQLVEAVVKEDEE